MWNETRATRILGIDYPIMQGPFGGGLSSVELVSTVSNMVGLGGYGAYTMTPQTHAVSIPVRKPDPGRPRYKT